MTVWASPPGAAKRGRADVDERESLRLIGRRARRSPARGEVPRGRRRLRLERAARPASRRRGAARGWILQPLDPARIGVEHLEFEVAGAGDDLAAHRHAAGDGGQQAADRVDVLGVGERREVESDRLRDVFEAARAPRR